MEFSCRKYAEKFPHLFPLENYSGEKVTAVEFSEMYGLVDVQEGFHQYEPPRSLQGISATQCFAWVLTTFWRAEQ